MENNKYKYFPMPIVIVAYILSAAQIAELIYSMTRVTSLAEILVALVGIAARVCAIIFFAKGFGKDANRYYRAYFLLVAAKFLLEDFLLIFSDNGLIPHSEAMLLLFEEIICYGNVLVLGVAKDLGKIKSVLLAAVNAAVYAFGLVSALIAYDPAAVDSFENLLGNIAWFLGAVICLLMVFAKYADKEARGTK